MASSAQILNLLFADPDLQTAIQDRLEDMCLSMLDSEDFRKRVENRLNDIVSSTTAKSSDDRFITAKEAAEILGYNRDHFLKICDVPIAESGLGLKRYYLSDSKKSLRFKLSEVEAL